MIEVGGRGTGDMFAAFEVIKQTSDTLAIVALLK